MSSSDELLLVKKDDNADENEVSGEPTLRWTTDSFRDHDDLRLSSEIVPISTCNPTALAWLCATVRPKFRELA